MWSFFFQTVERATGKPVRFAAFEGGAPGGLRAVLVDGCKQQIDAFGDFLVRYNEPLRSGIDEMDPQKIVEYLIKLCGVHFDRFVPSIAGSFCVSANLATEG